MGKREYYRQWLYVAFRHTIGWGDGVAFLIGISLPIARQFIPNWEAVMNELAWQIPLGVFSAIILARLLLAPYWIYKKVEKERDELKRLLHLQKRIPLRNREALIRTIAVMKEKAIEVKMRQDDLNFKEKRRENPHEELSERDNAWFAYLDAKRDLETERLVAGDNFRAVIDKLIVFLNYHVDDCMNIIRAKNKPETLKTIPFMGQLEDNIEQTIRDLDALSLQEPDK